MLVFERNEQMGQYQGAPRAGFTFTYVRPLHSYALFGGANADNDLYLFSITKSAWTIQPTGGPKKPPSRKYHAAAFIEGVSCLLVSGGEDDQGRCLEDFFILSIRDWKWRKLIVVKSPQPRERHCIFSKNDLELILFGGVSHYNENTKDIWLLKAQTEGKQETIGLESSKLEIKGKVLPEGRVLAQTTLFQRDRLFAGLMGQKSDLLRVFCFQFRLCEWREIELGLRCSQARMFRAVKAEQQTFILALSNSDRRSVSPSRFLYFDSAKYGFKNIQDEAELLNNCDEFSGEGGEGQILCLRQGKRLFTARYAILRTQEPESSIQDYLIAIKHQQILSQELARKNSQLEELYREMQSYITRLHKQYLRFQEDPAIEAERASHIQDCHQLKREYARLDRLYESASQQVRGLRGQLGAINEDFERCMDTQFDEEA